MSLCHEKVGWITVEQVVPPPRLSTLPTMASSYVLLQFGSDLFNHRFEDLESRPAFTVYVPPRNIADLKF